MFLKSVRASHPLGSGAVISIHRVESSWPSSRVHLSRRASGAAPSETENSEQMRRDRRVEERATAGCRASGETGQDSIKNAEG